MNAKWPFMLITVGLLFALGLTIANLERNTVMNNWTNRRCELPIIVAAAFFKPDSDPRTSTDFAKENFSFCMKSVIEKFIELFMAPINAVFGTQVNIAGAAVDGLNTIRKIAQTMYNVLLSYLDQYYRRFNASVFEMSRIVQYLRMAMNRANAAVMSMLYTGLTVYRGMLNFIRFIVKVIMIIVGIIMAILIILIFVLFPLIPLILSVLGVIIAVIVQLQPLISNELSDQASGAQGGLCFAESATVIVRSSSGKDIRKSVKEIRVGDELGDGSGRVTAVITMNGKNVQMYSLNGIIVSGTHLVKGTDGVWKSVSEDERAHKIDTKTQFLYCFNTTSHTIPIVSSENQTIQFRDWEELEDGDATGHYTWNYLILKMLNKSSHYDSWKNSLKSYSNTPLMSSRYKIKTRGGYKELSKIVVGDRVIDSCGEETDVLGVVKGEVDGVYLDLWNTELYEFENGVWIKGNSTGIRSNGGEEEGKTEEGLTIITDSGTFILLDETRKKETVVRDFTEVGHKSIHETYSFVADRLRII